MRRASRWLSGMALVVAAVGASVVSVFAADTRARRPSCSFENVQVANSVAVVTRGTTRSHGVGSGSAPFVCSLQTRKLTYMGGRSPQLVGSFASAYYPVGCNARGECPGPGAEVFDAKTGRIIFSGVPIANARLASRGRIVYLQAGRFSVDEKGNIAPGAAFDLKLTDPRHHRTKTLASGTGFDPASLAIATGTVYVTQNGTPLAFPLST
jgi:hypothetical protein